jgi:glucan exporter ATP-binding protein
MAMQAVDAVSRSVLLLKPEWKLASAVTGAGIGVAALQVLEPVLFGAAIDALSKSRNPLPFVGLWFLISFGAFLAGMVVSLTADRMSHRRRLSSMAQFLEHVLALPSSFHSQAKSGRLMRIMISGCDSLFSIWLPLFREQLINVVTILVLVPVALYLNWRLALLLVVLMVVFAWVNATVIKRTSGGQAAVEGRFTDISGRVGDLFGNVPVLQSFMAIPGELRNIRRSLDQLLAEQYPVLNWWAALTVLTRGASSISIVAIFAMGALLVWRDLASIGEIVTFVGFANLLIGRLEQLNGFVTSLAMRAPSLAQFFEILDERSNIIDKPNAPALKVTRGHVVFENVTFRYPSGSGAVTDLTFEAKPGETIAIVGPTGSGKTTTLALLQRAYDPDAGRILIDGQDIRDVSLASLRHSIGVVFQEAGLFNRSIAENIALGRPEATHRQVIEAAKIADAYDFVMRKPGGFSAMVGERGQGLSGGERQRLAVARAMLKNAPILILDEATSALDVATEAKLQSSLDRLRQDRTTFVIAHRLSTVRSANKILVLEAGRIVEEGSFDELVALSGVFAKLVRDGGISAINTHQPVSEDQDEGGEPRGGGGDGELAAA